MTPGEVLIQQQLAYEALAALNRTVSDSLHQPDKPVTVAMDTEVAGTGSEEVGGKGRGKKRLSVREMVRPLSTPTYPLPDVCVIILIAGATRIPPY